MSKRGDPVQPRPPARGVTIRDVAKAANISISTVSRALRNPELLDKRTLETVREAVARLNYRPNLAAQNLRGTKTQLVLLVIPSLSPFFIEICRGAEEAAAGSGYNVLVGHTARRLEQEIHLIDQVHAGRADGVVLVTSVDLQGLIKAARLPPLVVALDVDSGTDLPTVHADHSAGARGATRYLVELGHRRIAHICGPKASGMTAHRLDGYKTALAEAGIPIDPKLIIDGDFTLESGESALRQLIARGLPATAVFAANDQMAMGAMRAARAAGLQVPADLSILGFDDERLAALYDPPLSTVRIPTFDIGYRAMKQLIALISGEDIERHIVFETELAVRASTAPPRRA